MSGALCSLASNTELHHLAYLSQRLSCPFGIFPNRSPKHLVKPRYLKTFSIVGVHGERNRHNRGGL